MKRARELNDGDSVFNSPQISLTHHDDADDSISGASAFLSMATETKFPIIEADMALRLSNALFRWAKTQEIAQLKRKIKRLERQMHIGVK